jgi:multidrug efflux pump subunit AcrA (membrane-fusion protein)
VTGTVFGTVSSVSVLSSSSSGSASYPVTIAVTGAPSGLHDGASATVTIIYQQLANVLTVPTAAVHTDNGSSYVLVSANGKQTRTTVKTGLSSGGSTQITSGLKAGQQVVEETVVRTGGSGSTGRTGTGTTRGGFGGAGGGTGEFPGGGTGNFPGGGTGGGTGGGFGGARP